MNKAVLLAPIALLALSACGGGGGGGSVEKSATDGASGALPTCSDIWKVGNTLDLSDYHGCVGGENSETGLVSGCYDADSNYRGQFATLDDKLWVIQTGTDPKWGTGGTPGKVTDVDPKC